MNLSDFNQRIKKVSINVQVPKKWKILFIIMFPRILLGVQKIKIILIKSHKFIFIVIVAF